MPIPKKWKCWSLVLLALPLWLGTATAQPVRRVELPVASGSETFQTVPLGKNGVLLISKSGKSAYNLLRLDVNLDKVWGLEGKVDNNLEFTTYYSDGQSVYLLFSNQRSGNYQVSKVLVGPGIIQDFFFSTLETFQVTDFKPLGSSVFLAGIIREEPILLVCNLPTGQVKILPGAGKGASAVQSIEVDPVNQEAIISFAVRDGRAVKIVARTYAETGRQLDQIIVEPTSQYSLLNGRLVSLNDSVRLLVGTYGIRSGQNAASPASQGLYISRLDDRDEVATSYYSFTDFTNFFRFLNERQQEKMEKRIQRKKETGGDIRLNYRLLIHDIIQKDDQQILVAEVFYPEFRYQGFPGSFGPGSWWGPYTYAYGPSLWNPYSWNPWYGYGTRGVNNAQIFDGYVYTHAIVAGFNQEGKLLWDNSFELNKYRSWDLREKVKVSLGPDQLTLFYSDNGAIHSRIVRESEVLEGRQKIPFGPAGSAAVQRMTTDDVEFWYDHYYLAWGYQRLGGASSVAATGAGTSPGRSDNAARSVFYLSKISF